ncbi:putative ankyrin repeat protein [Acanthamoeba polyphaga mimivirus]|uniref:Ankyrin repeat protein n=1 Tax=Acanthamoeba polyphaga mimivirus Kroon TaxID=3069720 RepID=A0A0G2Y7V3_9VIRU|nr:putative ankyrin repeat protein [Acanthamoeba polyphaga mimivirus]AKI80634.1 putative ankyrin repeat protein [Acanthamoeba polyphaga mimivirus Kroon]
MINQHDHPLVKAVKKGKISDLIHFFTIGKNSYANKFDVQSLDNFAIKHACFIGNEEMVRYLISEGADVNAEDVLTVTFASRGNHIKILELLFTQKIDIKKNREALHSACNNGHYEIVKFLISKGAIIDNSMLVIAAYQGHLDIVKYLVSNGVDISHHDFYALEVALEKGHQEVADYLISEQKKI